MPRLPVGHAGWRPRPDFRTAATAWLLADTAHHTAVTTQIAASMSCATSPGCRWSSCSSSMDPRPSTRSRRSCAGTRRTTESRWGCEKGSTPRREADSGATPGRSRGYARARRMRTSAPPSESSAAAPATSGAVSGPVASKPIDIRVRRRGFRCGWGSNEGSGESRDHRNTATYGGDRNGSAQRMSV